MICPRCDEELEYGTLICTNCGLKFKYNTKENISKCKRSTACILAYIFGALGLHNFYLGYFVKGVIRLTLFILFCGFFVSPQIMMLISTGNFRITYDYYGIFGLVMLGIVVVSYLLCIVEFVNIILGNINTDARGYKLK